MKSGGKKGKERGEKKRKGEKGKGKKKGKKGEGEGEKKNIKTSHQMRARNSNISVSRGGCSIGYLFCISPVNPINCAARSHHFGTWI